MLHELGTQCAVPPWEVSGTLGHQGGYKTTEIYAKYAPDYLGKATAAIDDYFELQEKVSKELILEGPVPIRGRA